jgi:hypothetical protein
MTHKTTDGSTDTEYAEPTDAEEAARSAAVLLSLVGLALLAAAAREVTE